MKALIALVYIVTSVLAPIMGWLYPGDTEQATAQPFLADSLEQTLLPGQALWVRLGPAC